MYAGLAVAIVISGLVAFVAMLVAARTGRTQVAWGTAGIALALQIAVLVLSATGLGPDARPSADSAGASGEASPSASAQASPGS